MDDLFISVNGGPSQGRVRPNLIVEWATLEGQRAIARALMVLVRFHAERLDPELAGRLIVRPHGFGARRGAGRE